ncbi:glycosyltransferase [Peribacillus kribbensis]|uniref:glycosyltransferase n=1 Tax=Peribacillus kribbensis TaxID=356658 RepID=UPI00041C6F68|nr:glycosyltransferase [Peribacillus kribbensis]
MKKKVLFVMNKLVCGGAEKSLISLLERIDYSRYDVDLFLFKHEGIFLNKLPKEVNLLSEPKYYKYFDMPINMSILQLCRQKKLHYAIFRVILGCLAKLEKNSALIEQKFWRFMSKALENLPNEYDAAIGYLEKNPIYFCVDKVNAKKKFGWIHTDYNKLEVNPDMDHFYIKKLNKLITVSDDLVNILKNKFPNSQGKIMCMHNIVSPDIIRSLSRENVDIDHNDSQSKIMVSVGRLAKEKGLDIALDAVYHLIVNKGYDLKWLVIGEGDMRTTLESKIKEFNLHERVKLLGLKENPYPYIKRADIFLQTSRYEGKSISIDEAKILGKPIVITNFETAENHINDGETGLIAEMTAHSVADKIELLLTDDILRTSLINNLNNQDFGTEIEVNKLYELIEGEGTQAC